MARKFDMTTEYLSNRSDANLFNQFTARVGDLRTGVKNDDHWGHPIGTSFRIAQASDAMERLYAEMEIRGLI